MAHWTVDVSGVSGSAQLERVFSVCERLDIELLSARYRPGHLTLELASGMPAQELDHALRELGLSPRLQPGDHSLEALSEREQELVRYLAMGLQMKEVARAMGIQTNTVREYWSRTKRKLGVRSMGQAVAMWTAADSQGRGSPPSPE